MSKWIFLEKQGKVISCLMDGRRMTECRLDDRKPAFVGSIFTARVDHLVPGIQAAFLSAGEKHFYLSLRENPRLIYTKQARPDMLTQGDEILIQVEKDAIKTKEPVARGILQLSGRYGVVMYPEKGIHFSKKITDKTFRSSMRQALENRFEEGVGLLIRTNAADASQEEVISELEALQQCLRDILEKSPYRSVGSLLWQPLPAYLKTLQNLGSGVDEVITDDEGLYQELSQTLKRYDATSSIPCRLYQDKLLSLDKCWRISHLMEKAMEKQVWLASGAFLVIEQTEALTAIDINTGKAESRKQSMEDFIFEINLEAAEEIMAQIRLRNLSGILILDFINMRDKKHEEALLACLRHLAALDPVQTAVVDITPLGLVEITRKKETDTLLHQYRAWKESCIF